MHRYPCVYCKIMFTMNVTLILHPQPWAAIKEQFWITVPDEWKISATSKCICLSCRCCLRPKNRTQPQHYYIWNYICSQVCNWLMLTHLKNCLHAVEGWVPQCDKNTWCTYEAVFNTLNCRKIITPASTMIFAPMRSDEFKMPAVLFCVFPSSWKVLLEPDPYRFAKLLA